MTCIIVFAEDWQGHPSSSQHIVRQLTTRHQVVWVNSIGLRSPRLNWRDLGRLWHKACALLQQQVQKASAAQTNQPVAVIAPRCLPFHQFSLLRAINRYLLCRQIERRLADCGISAAEPRVLWLALPSAVCMVGALSEKQVIYYCGDDFSALAGVDHHPISQLEQQLAERADVIFCASEKLQAKFAPAKTRLLPHGVDVELFSQIAHRPKNLPVGRPIAGFYGLLADWLDVELLAALAEKSPEWDFVLIGRVATNVQLLQNLSNVYFIAEMPHQQLVQYACHFQALLMPFCHCQQIEFCNPLKLREYLAIGAPVLSIEFPALQPYSHQVLCCDELADWIANLQQIAQWTEEQRLDYQQQSRALVGADSWQARARQVEAWMLAEQSAVSCVLASTIPQEHAI